MRGAVACFLLLMQSAYATEFSEEQRNRIVDACIADGEHHIVFCTCFVDLVEEGLTEEDMQRLRVARETGQPAGGDVHQKLVIIVEKCHELD